MSVINQMLRDLDRRGAAASVALRGTAAPLAVLPAAAASARGYAATRMPSGTVRHGRNIALVCAVVAALPIAWATTQYNRPAAVAPAAPVSAANAVGPVDARPRVDTATTPLLTISTAAPDAVSSAAPLALAPLMPAQPALALPAPVPPTPALLAAKVRAVRVPIAAGTVAAHDVPNPATEPADTRVALTSLAAPKEDARIERRPTYARDDLTRAGEAMAIGRISDALVLLRKVILAEPENERARLARLALLSLLADRQRDDTWRSALVDSARAMPLRFGVAAAQGMAESGRYELSLAVLEGMPESTRDLRYFSALGATQQQLNHHAEAVAAFDGALQRVPAGAPQQQSLLVAQALSMQSLGDTLQARRNFERVRQMPDAAADVREYVERELARGR